MVLDPEHPLHRHASELSAAARIWVAYSGGLDSTLLLKLASEITPPERLVALHVNHGIHPDADKWERLCAKQCERLGVHFQTVRIRLASAASLEAEAREKRYQAFAEKLGSNELLLMAHHADDQAETLLFRMMRGAGLRGLAGMPEKRSLGKGELLRPMLRYRKSELLELARLRQLEWVEDSSNQDTSFSRNFIRHQIIPVLEQHWPSAVERINQSALALEEAGSLLDQYASELVEDCDPKPEPWGMSLDLRRFNALSEARRNLLLRHQLALRGEHPDKRRLQETLSQLGQAESESHIRDSYSHLEIRVFHFRLYLLEPLWEAELGLSQDWDATTDLELAGIGILEGSVDLAGEGPFRVSFRQGGERAHPVDRDHSQSLKKLLQEHQVPPWLRDRIPLIYRGQSLVAVAGLFSCDENIPTPRLVWGRATDRSPAD